MSPFKQGDQLLYIGPDRKPLVDGIALPNGARVEVLQVHSLAAAGVFEVEALYPPLRRKFRFNQKEADLFKLERFDPPPFDQSTSE